MAQWVVGIEDGEGRICGLRLEGLQLCVSTSLFLIVVLFHAHLIVQFILFMKLMPMHNHQFYSNFPPDLKPTIHNSPYPFF